MLDQNKTPIFDALKKYVDDGVISFHVPGHKGGKGLEEFREYVGNNVLAIDVNGMEDLDNICNPISTIMEAQQLAAQAWGADHAHFLVNGTSMGIQAMIMTICRPGDKLILPRNAHKSAIGGMILSGAKPVYIQPEIDEHLGIAMGITPEAVRRALVENPDAKGVFVINPTYYGVASNLKEIVEIAHSYGKPVLVDEAHGAHFPFHKDLPMSAMEAGADIAATSTHKMGGSMTQSSILLVKGDLIDNSMVKKALNLTQTTSASYVLIASIDAARKQLAIKGNEMLDKTLRLSHWAREQINQIDGIHSFSIEKDNIYGFVHDPTKIAINVRNLGLSGYDVEKILRRDYNIQIELSDIYNILALITIGDNEETVGKLIDALKDLANSQKIKNLRKFTTKIPETPELVISPREAYYANTRSIPLEDAEDEISAEMIMAYPPGIPIICPGERVTAEVINYVKVLKREKCQLQGTADSSINYLRVVEDVVVMEFNKDLEEVQVG